MKRAAVRFAYISLFIIFAIAVAGGQSGTPAESPSPDPQFSPHRSVNNGAPLESKEQQHQMEKQQREKREKQLKDDSTRLLQLATELKDSVDKSNENVLSLDVVKKAEEIEKLAKHIKTNMRDEVR
ncbi:MAG TPA: hypothetical protein VGL89_12130 [Candidatus Koribacter sp.]|jgi:hypothetical protein